MSRLSKILFAKKPISASESFIIKMGIKRVPRAGKMEQLFLLLEDTIIDSKDAVKKASKTTVRCTKKGSKKSWNFMTHLRIHNPFYIKD